LKSHDGTKRRKKLYEKPTATPLSPEEAKAKLRRMAKQGNQDAKEMFRKLFPDELIEKDEINDQRKSA
jgi:hypothetical protein